MSMPFSKLMVLLISSITSITLGSYEELFSVAKNVACPGYLSRNYLYASESVP